MRDSSSGKVHISNAIFEISSGSCTQLSVSVSGALISLMTRGITGPSLC